MLMYCLFYLTNSLLFQPEWGWVLAAAADQKTLPARRGGEAAQPRPRPRPVLRAGRRDGVPPRHHLALAGRPPAPPRGQQQELHWRGPVVQQGEALQGKTIKISVLGDINKIKHNLMMYMVQQIDIWTFQHISSEVSDYCFSPSIQ